MEPIHTRIGRCLRTGEGEFEALALDLFRYQFDRNASYQAYCRSMDRDASKVKRWQDIPAVPVRAFQSAVLASFPPAQAAAVFESSGTTTSVPSRHYLKTLEFYETSLKAGFRNGVLDIAPLNGERFPMFILTPPPAEAPRSSLSWMMEVVRRQWGAPGSHFLVRQGRLDDLWLSTLLSKSEALGEPVVLMGTTIAFLSFFDACERSRKFFSLPGRSRIMDTGGLKSHRREVTRADFVRRAGEVLGIPETHCINEYGMCELSSQFYGEGRSERVAGPPWVRTLVVDPETGKELPEGTIGLLRHFDLANVDSVLAIQTEDLGQMEKGGFLLKGRSPDAVVKGCSISAEAFLS